MIPSFFLYIMSQNTISLTYLHNFTFGRDYEPIRLLSLQFLGRLLYDVPSERKGPKFFNLAVGRTKSLSQGHKKIGARTQPIFLAMSDRLFQYPQTDNLRATLFDVLLGGASPKQVSAQGSIFIKHLFFYFLTFQRILLEDHLFFFCSCRFCRNTTRLISTEANQATLTFSFHKFLFLFSNSSRAARMD